MLGSIGAGVLLNRKMSPLTLGLTAVALVGAGGGLIFAPNIGVALSSLMFLVCSIGAGAAIGLGFAMVPVVAPSPAAYGAAGALCNQLVNLGLVIGPPAAFSALHAETRGDRWRWPSEGRCSRRCCFRRRPCALGIQRTFPERILHSNAI